MVAMLLLQLAWNERDGLLSVGEDPYSTYGQKSEGLTPLPFVQSMMSFLLHILLATPSPYNLSYYMDLPCMVSPLFLAFKMTKVELSY